MKYLILVVILLSGCQKIINRDIVESTESCKNNGGINYIITSKHSHDVYCGNGAVFTIKKGGE